MEEVQIRTECDFVNQIKSFERIGMLNPSEPTVSIDEAISTTKGIDLYYDIYPEDVMSQFKIRMGQTIGEVKPIKCMFLPSVSLLKKMMLAVLKFGSELSEEAFLLRFGIRSLKPEHLKA